MRILFDSQQTRYKDPFGTLSQGQVCHLRIDIPSSVGAVKTECVLESHDGTPAYTVLLEKTATEGAYSVFSGHFALSMPGLYFYWFRIYKPEGAFRLFKQGHDTNMEAGDKWQLTCTPSDFTTPDWAKGAIIYQIFPDRFCKVGNPDLSGKLTPYTIHEDWNAEVAWKPDENGKIWNNDFFGGNFPGITQKMDYISALGATILYLNPICKSFSNHRYDTFHYKLPDPMLGTEADFVELCHAAHQCGIRVVLDGVFSHTGSDSIYFASACDSPDSPYYSWYTFYDYPSRYNSWWGFKTLPTVNKMAPAFLDYIIHSEDSVVAHWLKLGADGFRLDVVDELPNEFVLQLKKRIREIKPDALLIGEVWEDASNKISYGIRRRYFADGELDSCMNYPFRSAILNFLRGQDDGIGLKETVMTIAENYPPQVLACNMNLLGSHDTPRILTALADDFEGTRADCAMRRLSDKQKKEAKGLLLLATVLQYTLPGSPSIYYADEVGMEGHKDPFNRRTYPWGKEDTELLNHYRRLGALRNSQAALRLGDIRFFHAKEKKIGFYRSHNGTNLKIYVNLSSEPWAIPNDKVLLAHKKAEMLSPMGYCITEVHGQE